MVSLKGLKSVGVTVVKTLDLPEPLCLHRKFWQLGSSVRSEILDGNSWLEAAV